MVKVCVARSKVVVEGGVLVGVKTWSFVVALNLTALGWGLNEVGGADFPLWLWCAGARGLLLSGWCEVRRGGPLSLGWGWWSAPVIGGVALVVVLVGAVTRPSFARVA